MSDESKRLAGQIVAAYVRANNLPAGDIPNLIRTTYEALARAGQEPERPVEAVPAVPVKRSITPDAIVCLDCGQPFKMLKRHLGTDHHLTPDEYRARWGLSRDYPIVAPNYAIVRSALAKASGLGRTPEAKGKRKRRNAA